MTKAMSGMTEIIQKSIQPTMSAINTMVASMMPIKEMTSQITAFSRAIYGQGGILGDIAKIDFSSLINVAVPKISPVHFPVPAFPVYTPDMKIVIKRAYDKADNNDGYRVLVDRLWPRGIKKEELALDEWCKAIAPSTELRKWFAHDPVKFSEFTAKYTSELEASDAPQELLRRVKNGATLTLVYAAKDPKINHVVVLREYLLGLAG